MSDTMTPTSPPPIPTPPTPTQFQPKTVVLALGGLIGILAVGYLLSLVFLRVSRSGWGGLFTQPSPLATPLTQAGPVNVNYTQEIVPLIKPCAFPYFNSCLVPRSEDTEFVAQKYDQQAEIDILFWLGRTNSALKDFRVELSDEQLRKYFPERVAAAQEDPRNKSVSASMLLKQVSAHHNLHPRLLLLFMELQWRGQSPVSLSTVDLNKPFFAEPAGFLAQLEQVALELRGGQTKYELMKREQRLLPPTLTFFDKTYTVAETVTPETLAIVEFIAKHAADRATFEKAIKVIGPNETLLKLQINDTDNFVTLYQKMFEEDPRE